jgi:hypothetical protein
MLRLRAGRFVVATDRGQVNADLRGSLATQLAAHVPALRSGVEPWVEGPVYVSMPPPAVRSVVDEMTEPMSTPPVAEPMVITVRLPPVRLPPAPRVLPLAPPFLAPPAPPMSGGPYAGFVPVDRTLPLPRPSAPPPAPPPPIAKIKRRLVSREAWMRVGAVAAVVAVAVSGLAVGVGLRVFQGSDASDSPAAR